MKLVIIGAGNMGEALARGIVRAGLAAPADLTLTDIVIERARTLADELGAAACADNRQAVATASLVILLVKPPQVAGVCREIGPVLPAACPVLVIAAGVTIRQIKAALGREETPVARAMPNTPCLVGAGATGLTVEPNMPAEIRDTLVCLLSAVGIVEEVPESLQDAVTGLSGSGPAYIAVLIEALADGGVLMGLPRAQALRLAIQTVRGTATLLQETGRHPAQVKDAVSSPGGTTITALAALEAAGFRHAVLSAVKAAAARAHELSGE